MCLTHASKAGGCAGPSETTETMAQCTEGEAFNSTGALYRPPRWPPDRGYTMSTITVYELRNTLMRIADEATRAYPRGEFELHLHSRKTGPCTCLKGDADAVFHKLIEFCAQFPGALIRYTLKHPYGMLSDIVCSCDGIHSPCQSTCRSMAERPRASLLLVCNGTEALLLGRHEPPGWRHIAQGAGLSQPRPQEPGGNCTGL